MAQQSPLKDFQRRGKKPERVNIFDGAAQTSFVKTPEISDEEKKRKQKAARLARRVSQGDKFKEELRKRGL